MPENPKHPVRGRVAYWIRLLSAVPLMVVAALASGSEQPLWELSLGAGVITIPEYRGSDDQRTAPFPFIYPVYRGKRLRVDDDGFRGVLYESSRVEFDISADGNPDVDSDNSARQGMPDLDPTLQLGPLLQLRLMADRERRHTLLLNLPARAVFAVSFDDVEQVGYTASPHLTYHKWFDLFNRPWRMGLSAGLEFGSNEYHDFYYRVAPEFATPTRPAFDPGGGFGGTRFIASFVSRTASSWISVFARYDRFDGADFEDSPLVQQQDGLTLGAIYAWTLARSKRLVDIESYKKSPQ